MVIVKYLGENGIKPTERDLIATVNRNHLPVVKYLVENGANIHVGNDSPLIYALLQGNIEIVKYLNKNIVYFYFYYT